MSDAPHPKATPEAMREIQDSIYREKILRARAMTPGERIGSGFELTNSAMRRMLDGAMAQKGLTDEQEGWIEVKARLARLASVADRGLYTTAPPTDER